MIYCVVPRELEQELYPKLMEHYSSDEGVKVIVERRVADRRARRAAAGDDDPAMRERRSVRDRRRKRATGDLLPLAQP